jgi:hypothetical protein
MDAGRRSGTTGTGDAAAVVALTTLKVVNTT